MKLRYAFAVLAVLALAGALASAGSRDPRQADAAFHLMRVYTVFAGFNGDDGVQYVELRMASGGQTLVSGKKLCFFGADGSPWATFTFPANVGNGAAGSSILVASPGFAANWPAGSPDFAFSGATVVKHNDAANVTAPVPHPAGKVGFGDSCSSVDSVAYGSLYTGTAEHAPAFPDDLPTGASTGLQLKPGFTSAAGANATDYELTDVNLTGNQPRNNSGQEGPLGEAPPTTPPASPTASPTPTATPTVSPEPSETESPEPTQSPTATPTPSATQTHTPGPSATFNPVNPRQGDADCDADVDNEDGVYLLEYAAELEGGEQPAPCPDLQEVVGVSGFAWGDVNCDGAVDAIDALFIFAYLAAVPLEPATDNCFRVGNVMT